MGRFRNMPESIRRYISRQTTRKEPFKRKLKKSFEISLIPCSKENYNNAIKKLSLWLGDPKSEGKTIDVFARYEKGGIIAFPLTESLEFSGVFARDTSLIKKLISPNTSYIK